MINGTLAIGFASNNDQTLWQFFSSIALALLTAYQAMNFILGFYQLIRVFIDKRRIELASSDEAHMVQGVSWVTAGFKLGAIETVIGFAPSGFGTAFTRRIVRLLARATLIIGVVKGLVPYKLDISFSAKFSLFPVWTRRKISRTSPTNYVASRNTNPSEGPASNNSSVTRVILLSGD